MKQLFLSIILLFGLTVKAQELPTDPSTGKVTYTDVIQATGQTNKTLFEKAKKWVVSKNSDVNPYSISMDNEQDGSIIAKGTFALPGDRRKYVVHFSINILTKKDKCKYMFTDLVIQFRTPSTSGGGGFGYYGGSSHREAETLEYSLETFYPIRLEKRNKPDIKWYEEIRKGSFETIDKEMQSIVNSFKQVMTTTKEDW